ncbi:uncharacterized protein LOC126092504 isoform X2 [Schistocerca cancellata]|uniref:uncharacterized protein LOC126092504 isoform X2 n=1 Tax=Schistocerca cancellata TaxID=274614 RepID=UPI0021184580|nr:uncharacterized protein LOC126092504 isoform X2 [Schistocerca cancellata]
MFFSGDEVMQNYDLMDEFLVFHPPRTQEQFPSCPTPEPLWDKESTLKLIEFYRIHHERLGKSRDLKRKQQLWDAMSTYITKALGKTFSPAQWENKWRCLLRSYKGVVDNNKKSGRGRKDFVYMKEMDEIFEKKTNIYPEILLDGANVVAKAATTDQPSDQAVPGPSGYSTKVKLLRGSLSREFWMMCRTQFIPAEWRGCIS